MTGYCTAQDVLDVFQDHEFTGPIGSASQEPIVVKVIGAQSRWVEKQTNRHWYDSEGVVDDDFDLIPTSAKTRDDEHDIPTHGGYVHGASEARPHRHGRNSDALLESGPLRRRNTRKARHEPKRDIRIATGTSYAMQYPWDEDVPAYTKIRLQRKDVEAVNELSVINESGGYDDWVASSDYDGGVGNAHRGEDYWVRINNEGPAEGYSDLYLDVHSMDDEIASFSNAVYVDISYGKDSLPRRVRQGVALLSAAELILDDELQISIPDSGQLVNVETKAQRWERQGHRQLEPDFDEPLPELS